MSNQLFSLCF